MRALVIALALLGVLPAGASARIVNALPVPQDQSITGAVVASPAQFERTVRFTLKNNGPGPVEGFSYMTIQPMFPMTIVTAPGCTIRTVAGRNIDARCEFGAGLPAGATRSIDARVLFTGNDFTHDQVVGTAFVAESVGGFPVGDSNPANDQVTVDLGLVPPPPTMKLDVFARPERHGTAATTLYMVHNTGGVQLTDVRVTDDRCPNAQSSSGATTIPPLLGMFSQLSFVCTVTAPPHRKGEEAPVHHVTATARAGNQVLTSRRTVRSVYQEPVRACGTFTVMRKGKRRTYDAQTVHPDVRCKKVRKNLARCLRRRKAPKGFSCRIYGKGKLAYLRPKPFKGFNWMRAAAKRP